MRFDENKTNWKNKRESVDEVLKERQFVSWSTARITMKTSHLLWDQQLNWIRIHFMHWMYWIWKKRKCPNGYWFSHCYEGAFPHSHSNIALNIALISLFTLIIDTQKNYSKYKSICSFNSVHLFQYIFTFHVEYSARQCMMICIWYYQTDQRHFSRIFFYLINLLNDVQMYNKEF